MLQTQTSPTEILVLDFAGIWIGILKNNILDMSWERNWNVLPKFGVVILHMYERHKHSISQL